jgi:hypothetical protein
MKRLSAAFPSYRLARSLPVFRHNEPLFTDSFSGFGEQGNAGSATLPPGR